MRKTPKNGTPCTIKMVRHDGTVTCEIPGYWFNGRKVYIPQKSDE